MRRSSQSALAVALLGLLVMLLTLAAAVVGPLPAGAGRSDLPPSTLAALRKEYKAEVKPLGLRITRGLLQNIDTYEEDPEGTHLALYVAPTASGYTSAQYIENFTTLTREFIPAVFKRWKGLESFDICQEPPSDPRDAPPPVTQIFVTRDALDRVDRWRRANLTELLAASPRARDIAAGYYVYFSPAVRDDPAYVAAATAAGWTAEATAYGT